MSSKNTNKIIYIKLIRMVVYEKRGEEEKNK